MKKVVMLFLALLITSLSFAQTKVTGNVKDDTGEPITGATVTVKGVKGVGSVYRLGR